ncbi:3-hydroxybutyryl-CoA dehydrogenase [Bacillus piscicola]|uniref:3-hydroxybutyryl-CoA dehydrogenase n=1 Tax=Bacillus piscicola TaxID=1632684 RepID=UPI001F09EC7A|nr:3-hydroxybutyryl-CoA dehydrogenase [Bacillus piscicola]
MKSNRELIAIAGAGRMGRGIAITFAYQGYPVRLIDIKERSSKEYQRLKTSAFVEITKHLEILASGSVIEKNDISAILNRIELAPIEMYEPQSWEQVDILFEAVPEIIDVKESVFTRICPQLSEDALVASTTSSFSVNELADFISNKERFMNTHWLNPAYLIPLVEVSPGKDTDQKSLQKMFQLLETIGKVPIKCQPSPGFIVPRIQALAMNEASRLVEEDVASVEDIDKASRVGFGLRFAVLGLLEFIDWGGADTLFHASNYLRDTLQDDRFAPPEVIEEKMADGEIGMKTKKGFYSFSDQDIDAYQAETLKKFIDLLRHLGFLGVDHNEKAGSRVP